MSRPVLVQFVDGPYDGLERRLDWSPDLHAAAEKYGIRVVDHFTGTPPASYHYNALSGVAVYVAP